MLYHYLRRRRVAGEYFLLDEGSEPHDAEHQRILLAAHRPPRGQGVARLQPHPEEQTILTTVPQIADYVAAVKQRSRKVPGLALRQLLSLVREYPRKPLLAAVAEAARYGLYDLDRLERMILRRRNCGRHCGPSKIQDVQCGGYRKVKETLCAGKGKGQRPTSKVCSCGR